jgi:hypothetical protein
MSTWYGWCRRDRRQKWLEVCGPFPIIGECSKALGVELARRGILERNSCMTAGSYPRDVEAGLASTLTHGGRKRRRRRTGRLRATARPGEQRRASEGHTMPPLQATPGGKKNRTPPLLLLTGLPTG